MLKLFFDRASPFVYGLNFLSFLLILGLFGLAWGRPETTHLGPTTYFLIFTWAFMNALNWINWYPGTKGKLGIRLHFQKNVVPMSYILPLALGLKIIGVPELYLVPFALLFLPIYYVSIILLFFHFRDSSDLMPGYFSHNFYLEGEEDSCTQ